MKARDIRDWIIKEPFSPFTIHLSDGRTFDITHPDQVLIFYHKVTVGLGRDERGILEHSEDVAILHITSVEELRRVA